MIEPLAIIGRQFPKVVIPLVSSALHSIDIVVYDWRFYPTQPGHSVSLFNVEIAQAVTRGVKVRALVNSALVEHKLLMLGADAKVLHSKKLLHSKLLIVDSQKVVLGSHNYTQNGFELNEEASVLFQMATADNEFKRYFDRLWSV